MARPRHEASVPRELVVQLCVVVSAAEQLVVRAALDDFAALEHKDLVRVAHSRKPTPSNISFNVRGAKCVRWRGKSSPYQDWPNHLYGRLSMLGTAINSLPAGASRK